MIGDPDSLYTAANAQCLASLGHAAPPPAADAGRSDLHRPSYATRGLRGRRGRTRGW
jgi:hypothetical protein